MKPLEEIVAEHPLPWVLQEDCYYTDDMKEIDLGSQWGCPHYRLAGAAPAMSSVSAWLSR